MRKISLFGSLIICFMLIIAILMPTVSSSNILTNYTKNINDIPRGLWIIRGSFKYLDEDDEYIYLKTITARLTGIGAGLMFYHLRFPVSIKISKPFYGFLPTGSIPLPGFGLCKKWDYIEEESSLTEKIMPIDGNSGKALIATIYLELDPESQQVQDILDNYHSIPSGFLTDITITIPDPNNEDGEWFMIAPLFRTLIGDWIGIGPFFEIITPMETTIVHIPILWGDVHYWPPDSETPEESDEFIIDGWVPFISWEY